MLIVNDDQAEVLTGRDEPEHAAKVLSTWYPNVVVKMGAEGALWFSNGRPEGIRVPAEPVERIVDGTGAGDAFCAGLLPAWFEGKPPAEALAAGCRLAARALMSIGARPPL
jgi:sugar/nucleoside kinase (ribokinase family)